MRLFVNSHRWLSFAAIACAVALCLALSLPAFSYLSMYTRSQSGSAQPDHWILNAFPLTYSVNPSIGSNFSGGGDPIQIVGASFNTWTTAPNTALSISRAPDTTVHAAAFDGINLICFTCQDKSTFGSSTDTLAVTITTTADAVGQDTKHGTTSIAVGQILDADIEFNTAVQWSTGSTVTGNQQHLQTVATHEIGHFFGMDHSAIVRAVMFPFAPSVSTTLSYDDVAGISQLYPKSSPDVATGSITGTVNFQGGGAVFGAHVFADSTSSSLPFGAGIRKSPIGAMTLPDGTYNIGGVPPDSYTVTAEPLDDPVTDSDISGYASAFSKSSVQTNFTTRWH
jgi:hypothetical protein